MNAPICAACIEIHGRDTNDPIQCGVCRKIVGCFWHNRNSAHIRACERSRWPAEARAKWEQEHAGDVFLFNEEEKPVYRNRIREYRTVNASEIQRNALNFRRHPEHQRAALRGLLTSVGRVAPILAYQNAVGQLVCLDGHARLDESDEWEVAILDIDESEALTVLAMLDKIGADAEIDPDALIALLDSLPIEARQTAGQAWSDDELAQLLEDARALPEAGGGGDEFDPTPDEGETRTQLGDLWTIGGVHRLLVADCTDPASVARLMGGERADAVITDPPYGMDLDTDYTQMSDWFNKQVGGKYDGFRRKAAGSKSKEYDKVRGDNEPFDPSPLFESWGYCEEMFLWGGDYYAEKIPDRAKGCFLVWDKRLDEDLDRMFGSAFELCWSKQPHKRDIIRVRWVGYFGTETQDTRARVHPTQKPLEVIDWILNRHTDDGDLIVDPYLGSGTTLIAAHRTGRRCYGMEIAPRYADVILRRAEAEGLTVERATT